jgi:phosphate transport system substrate-binding protein
MYTLGQLLAAQYDRINPAVDIAVTPSSSVFGFDNTCQKSTQMGMSDVYIQDTQLSEAGCKDMVGIPVAISATVVVYNLPGAIFTALDPKVGDLFTLLHPVRFTPQMLADIYMGKIKMWNDPAIKALNPGLPLPAQRIRAYNTAEPGGSGFVFNQWLVLSDPAWSTTVGGVSLQTTWPANNSTGTPNGGTMVTAIQNTPYSLGFVGFDYAISNHLQTAALRNSSGVFQTPSLNGLSLAISNQLNTKGLGMPTDFRRSFVTVPGKGAFNPADFEFFVVHQRLTDAMGSDVATEVKSFLAWCVNAQQGQKFIESIEFHRVAGKNALLHGYIPVPPALYGAIQNLVGSLATQV